LRKKFSNIEKRPEYLLSLKYMEINTLPSIEFNGRSGLSRSLGARFTETTFLYTFMALAFFSGFFVFIDILLPLLKLHFKAILHWSCLFELVFFVVTGYIAWVLHETASLRVHLHGERVIYEIKDKGGVSFNFTDIQSIRFGRSQGVYGFFIFLQNNVSYHFPFHLERLDYILDTLHFHRPDLTQTPEFMKFRTRALAFDHVLAHNRSYLTRAHVKAISFYLLYPLYFRHSIARIKANPRQVSRDMSYEKRMETLCHKVNIGLSLATLALVALIKFHI
jgi:hypothetical protein